jgi:hypothetical protein
MAGMTLTATSSYAAKSVDPTNGKIQFSVRWSIQPVAWRQNPARYKLIL